MSIEQLKQQILALSSSESTSFQELQLLSEQMREAAGDILTDCELSLLFDECASRIEMFFVMAEPGIQRVGECFRLIVTTMQMLETSQYHENSGGLQ